MSSDNSRKVEAKIGPQLLGDPPKIDAPPPEPVTGDDEESPSDVLPSINIYDDDTNVRFLICGLPCSLVKIRHQVSYYFLLLPYLSVSITWLPWIYCSSSSLLPSGHMPVGISGGWP